MMDVSRYRSVDTLRGYVGGSERTISLTESRSGGEQPAANRASTYARQCDQSEAAIPAKTMRTARVMIKNYRRDQMPRHSLKTSGVVSNRATERLWGRWGWWRPRRSWWWWF